MGGVGGGERERNVQGQEQDADDDDPRGERCRARRIEEPELHAIVRVAAPSKATASRHAVPLAAPAGAPRRSVYPSTRRCTDRRQLALEDTILVNIRTHKVRCKGRRDSEKLHTHAKRTREDFSSISIFGKRGLQRVGNLRS